MANIITSIRFFCAAALLFCPPLSSLFYFYYIVAGVSDMVDGVVARKTNAVSDFGAKLDTAADIVFVAVCLIRVLPVLEMPVWLYAWIVAIALVKSVNIVVGYATQKKFVALHSAANKVAGVLLFALPLSLPFVDVQCSGVAACMAATFAAVQEGYFIRTGRVGT